MIRDPQYIKLNIEYQNVRYSSIILLHYALVSVSIFKDDFDDVHAPK